MPDLSLDAAVECSHVSVEVSSQSGTSTGSGSCSVLTNLSTTVGAYIYFIMFEKFSEHSHTFFLF